MPDPYRIDVHHQILPPEYVSTLAGIGVTGGRGMPFPAWSAATAPFLAWRWSLLDFLPHTHERAPRGVLHYLKQFFYDTALSVNPHALRSLCELVGPSQIFFGTDFPFAPEPVTQLSVDGLAQYDGFDAAARRAIERDNALSLLPALHKRVEREET